MMAEGATDAGPVTKPVVLDVEGDDEYYLLSFLCERQQLRDRVHLHNLKGRDGLRSKLEAFATTEAEGLLQAKAFAVMIDAETQPVEDAEALVRAAVRAALTGLPEFRDHELSISHGQLEPWPERGLRVGMFIAPDGQRRGMLEDLCLDAVADHDAMACVDDFIRCLTEKRETDQSSPKRRLYAYIAAQQEPHFRISQAARAKYWDLEHNCWQPLKQFLRDLAGA